MNTTEYSIAIDAIESVTKKLIAIKKKADKLNCRFLWQFGDTEKPVEVRIRDKYGNILNEYTTLSRTLTIESEIIVNENYELWVKIDHNNNNGNIIITSDQSHEIDQNWFKIPPKCECCHSNHHRVSTFIIRDITNNRFLQVGSTCLREYTGIDPELTIAYLALYSDLYKYSCGEYSEDDFFVSRVYDVRIMIASAIKSINDDGYIKSDYRDSTKSKMIKINQFELSDSDLILSDKIIEWLKSNNFTDNFLTNCKNIVSNNFIKSDYLGFLAYLPVSYKKWMEKHNNNDSSNFVGNIGDKIQFDIKTWNIISNFETAYGTTFIYKFTDNKNNIYVWFTNSRPDNKEYIDENGTYKYRTCDLKTIKGTIKDHNEYKGEKQTILTRCKFTTD